ncbi:hypothetical protein NY2A_B077R [Paramecium bursaria Chlorella virus NY2A]|uniref:Uncharacterized protein B077R n=1 Tax=Paramecium bursaria Chlorella virus NY2A TaxID=46021 RepID=A7IVV2_PBCVN|nr:hypothetical protein NY2A_B077R [Paramecium bursaria Chlorella virus NY2A]YP_001498147.1 hypothetical protein AR158_C065R [Paramecium bursaria Chlorella virus AR158]ABT14476.1 hypothetical protein NY2A_B077R [Paramecium bursaria Chlorella virus NY2A]ABU43611.1 hypothetical protein AR158_C065R [Paramecium bursaria Chlorella virus AR158]
MFTYLPLNVDQQAPVLGLNSHESSLSLKKRIHRGYLCSRYISGSNDKIKNIPNIMDIIGTIAVSLLISYVYNVIYRPPKIVYYEYSPLPVSYTCKFS